MQLVMMMYFVNFISSSRAYFIGKWIFFLDSIENAVQTAYDDMERGRRELEKAAERVVSFF